MTGLILLFALLAAPAGARQAPEPPHLTVEGYGPVRIGMTRAQVIAALGTGLEGDPIDDQTTCIEMQPVGGYRGLTFMFLEGRLARVSIDGPSRATTPRGIGVGATAADVRRAYPSGLRAEEHIYEGPPGEFLTYWTRPNRRGIRFETDTSRRVRVIHAGTDAIEYAEGCA